MRSLLVTRPVSCIRHNMASTNITTAAWVTVVATHAQPSSAIEVYNGSASILQLALGGAGSEVAIEYYILPGGSSIMLPISVAKSVRISAKAIDANATIGSLILNFFG